MKSDKMVVGSSARKQFHFNKLFLSSVRPVNNPKSVVMWRVVRRKGFELSFQRNAGFK